MPSTLKTSNTVIRVGSNVSLLRFAIWVLRRRRRHSLYKCDTGRVPDGGMNLFKDLKYKLDRGSRRHIKYMVLLYAADILHACDVWLFHGGGDHGTGDVGGAVRAFTERCNGRLSSNPTRARYIKAVVTRHIIPVIRYVFSLQRRCMSRAETLNILSNYTHAPRFFHNNRKEEADSLLAHIVQNITLVVRG